MLRRGGRQATAMGASLWVRLISGCRLVAPSSKTKSVAGIDFVNYGSHTDAYPVPYFTVACALGITDAEVDTFLKKLDKTLGEWKRMKPESKAVGEAPQPVQPVQPPSRAPDESDQGCVQ